MMDRREENNQVTFLACGNYRVSHKSTTSIDANTR